MTGPNLKSKTMKVFRTRDVKLPARGTERSAGLDFYIPNDFESFWLSPGNSSVIPSGIVAEIPEGYMLKMCNKSGVCTRDLLVVGAEIIDEDYQGEIHLHVINVGRGTVVLHPGMKLVQGILIPVLYGGVEEVEFRDQLFTGRQSERGSGGFGSTGSGLEEEKVGAHERKFGHP